MIAATYRRWLGDVVVDVLRLLAVWLLLDRLGHVWTHFVRQRLVSMSSGLLGLASTRRVLAGLASCDC